MRVLIRLLPLAALLVAVAGCGGDKRATVSGKVTVGGKGPLTGGNIRFVSVSDPNRSGGGLINPDGTYEVPDAPVGDCKVIIDNTHLDPDAKKGGSLPGAAAGGMGPGPGMPGPGGMGKGVAGPGTTSGTSEKDKAKMAAPPMSASGEIPSGMSTKSGLTGQKYVKIDGGYSKPESTSLTFTVEKGANTKD